MIRARPVVDNDDRLRGERLPAQSRDHLADAASMTVVEHDGAYVEAGIIGTVVQRHTLAMVGATPLGWSRSSVSVEVVYSPDIFLLQNVGGISRYFVELHAELTKRGVDARLCAWTSQNQHLRRSPGRRRPAPSLAGSSVGRRATRIAYETYLASRPRSVVHHPTYFTTPAFRRRQPQVMTFYDLAHIRFPDAFPPSERAVADRQRQWAHRADRIIAISHSTARDLVDLLGVRESKIEVVHLGVRAGPPPPTDPRDTSRLLYVGGRGGYKNWGTLVHALSRPECQGLRLLCCGGGPPTAGEHTLLARLDLTRRVTFAAPTDEDLQLLYATSAALAYPSRYEGFGLPPLEAMAVGTPVVASNVASIPEVVGDAALLVDPDDSEQWAGAIAHAVEASTAQRLSQAGLERAKRFSWASTAEKTLNVYEQLVS